MFGFLRPFKPANREAQPAARQDAAWPPGMLVSKEDIYRENRGMAPILLLRKGFEVSPDELPRFIRNGARPQQFLFKPSESPDIGTLSSPEPLSQQLREVRRYELLEEFDAARNRPDASYPSPIPQTQKRVLILEPDQKALKRLIDCLFICGTSLDKIHSVRLPEQLAWAIGKYRPQVLVVDFDLPNGQTGLELLTGFPSLLSVEKIIFTVSPDAPLSEPEKSALEGLCPDRSVKFLKKPVSRFTVNRILAE
jgi:hypothetical protein